MSEKDDSVFAMRHTLAHVLMQALTRLYKDAKPGVGPAIENGFYHDFTSTHTVITEDLKVIEKEMRKIIAEDLPLVHEMHSADETIKILGEKGYQNTQELAQELKEQGEQEIGFYVQGEFSNMCKGPHVASTGKVGAFKLNKISGAYWRGDDKNEMMQRIYGVAFETKEELDAYLHMVEEAKKRDHRKLGQELDLFTFSDLVGSGLPLWTPRGTLLRGLLDDYVWKLRSQYDYEKVEIPHITKKELYETSGHWDKFKDELFKIHTREDHLFAMKPMNCPHHTQIYAHLPRSYRELPQRYANTTMVYRDEQSGELSGLSRVRCITQDDAHVFCRSAQVKEEMLKIWNIIDEFYGSVGFKNLQVRLSLHDPEHPENYLGSPEIWTQAEEELRQLTKEKGVDAIEAPGEAAFYGPKVDFVAKDSIGREWQVATIQLDMVMPENFNLSCTNEQGESERIVMIHCAIMGSIERFLSVIIEHFAGAFPVWLSPTQVHFLPVGEQHIEHCQKMAKELKEQGIRVTVDQTAETVGKKIRNAAKMKIPYILVIGDKELASDDLSVRVRGQEELLSLSKKDFIEHIQKMNATKSLEL